MAALDAKRLARVGETLRIEGAWDPAARAVRVTASDAGGALVASIERACDLPTRTEFRARLGADALPPEFEDRVPE